MVWIILVVILFLLLGAGVFVAIYKGDELIIWLAKHDDLWSPFRFKAPSGQFFIAAKGKSSGEMSRIYPSIEDVKLDEQHNFLEIKHEEWLNLEARKGYIEKELGVVWVGFFRKYFITTVKYISIDKIEKEKSFEVVDKTRNTSAEDPYYYYQYVMAAQTTEAEIGDEEGKDENIKVDMTFLFTTRIVNPYKAFFKAGKWTVRVVTAVERVSREFVKDKTFEQIRLEEGHAEGSLVGRINSLGNPDEPADPGAGGDKLRDDFGLEVHHTEFVKFGESAGDPEVSKALKQKALNKLNAEAAVDKGEEIKTLAKAEGEAKKSRYQPLAEMPGGAIFALADAIQATKLSTLVIGEAALSVANTQNAPKKPGEAAA